MRVCGLVLPAAQQYRLVGLDLLERMAAEPWHECGHEPVRWAHLDDGHEGAVVIEGDKRWAQVIVLRHEGLQG